MDKSNRVAVLFGGSSAERDISLMSGQAVLNGLLRSGVDAFAFDPAERDIISLKDEKPDLAFIVLHGVGGEDGTIQGALEFLGIPYTGSGVLGSALCMDKVRTKMLFQSAGLPTAPFRVIHSSNKADICAETILTELGGKVFFKPAHEGSSIGMTSADNQESFMAALETALEYDDTVLVESFIAGKEFTVAMLDGEALPVIQIRVPERFYDYQAKYFSKSTEYLCPAPIDAQLTEQIQSIAKTAFQTLNGQGWGRVDIMMNDEEELFLLEVNTVPGMTEKSLVPMAAKASGLDFDNLLSRIMQAGGL
ncbi:D-alanine--D-alanine ligase [Algicola sagamiensis]|uniref:D-alanine--D-alanine ligase n=1 Tax=Algicola sagamiensis TaxID=163869 RepID=UPI00035E57F2|nr:D-alanine--D-alanine ligase [Algicola sagamiensis]